MLQYALTSPTSASPLLGGRLGGFYFSRGFSSQIAEEFWFSHKEKKGPCVKETGFGLPAGGWGW